MENSQYWQSILLVITLIYGIVFGFRNVIMKIKLGFKPSKRYIIQSNLGHLLDAAFVVSVCYFCIIFVKF